MKQLYTIILFLLFVSGSGYAQDSLKIVLDNNFEGGADNFYSMIYPDLKYPRKARENCIMGSTYAHLYISGEGEIDSIVLSNELGYGIEKSITKALSNTSGNWRISEPLHLTLFIGFQIGDDAGVKGDIMINAYKSIGGKRVNDCKSSKELLKEFTKLVKKEKFKRAKKRIKELLQRDPNSEHYKGLLLFVEDKIK